MYVYIYIFFFFLSFKSSVYILNITPSFPTLESGIILYFAVIRTTLVYTPVLRNSVTSTDAKILNAFGGLLHLSARAYDSGYAHDLQILGVRTFNETKQ
jgi:hypothetical protein